MESLILVILVIFPGVWSGDWSVTFTNQCALKGTSVVIKCQYDYPSINFVRYTEWYKALYLSSPFNLVPLSDIPSIRGRFRYLGDKWADCSLEINNVQYSDEGAYYFFFRTTLNRWTSQSPARLTVKELTAVVQPSTVTEGDFVSLTCVSECHTPVDTVWFRDGHPVSDLNFQASTEDAGRYHCAVRGQERVRSASVALHVHYAPKKVSLSVSPSAVVVKGSSVTLTCSSDANPPVQSGYSLFKDGHFISSGPVYSAADIQPSHSGLYHCQAWNNISRRGIDLINSTEVHLDVQYHPVNVSISIDPPYVTEGSSVNLTCSSSANPPAENYTWYKRTPSPSSSFLLQVGSGQMLSLPFAQTSHAGLYLCQAGNTLGENNSTEVQLSMSAETQGNVALQFLSGVGVFLFVTLMSALLFFWRKRKTYAEKKESTYSQTVFDLTGISSSSLAADDPSNSVYMNISALPSSLPPAAAQEVDVTYSTVTIKPRNPDPPPPGDNDMRDSRSTAGATDDSVIYATVTKSSGV